MSNHTTTTKPETKKPEAAEVKEPATKGDLPIVDPPKPGDPDKPGDPPKLKAPTVAVGANVQYFTKIETFQYHGDEGPYAAIVTRVNEENIDLTVLPAGDPFVESYKVFGVLDDDTGDTWYQLPGAAAKAKAKAPVATPAPKSK